MLSSAGNSYNRDYLGETEDGSQMPILNVFRRDGGAIRHFWGSELLYAPTDDGRRHHRAALERCSTSHMRDAEPTGTSS
jgi:predicted dithiol-disulfide oxidoreductase (DUF899 family)